MDGEEQYVKERALEALTERMLPKHVRDMNLSILPDAAGFTAIVEACETLPFLAERRIVLVRESPFCLSERNDKRQEEDAGQLSAYVQALPAHVVLVFYLRGKADARKKTCAAIIKSGRPGAVRPAYPWR